MSIGRIGIGFLSFAHGHVVTYAQQIAGFPDAQLVACWDDDQERGLRNARQFAMSYSPHLEDVLHNPEVDCVIVGSETNKHTDLCLAALSAGKSVLLQKPMALTLAECDRIIEAVQHSGLWFSLAFQMRCDPVNIKMRQLLQEGAVGRVGTVRRRHGIGLLFNKDFVEGPTRWHLSAEANKGMFFDDAIHVLDWLWWTLGKRPVSVVAEIGNTLTQVAPDDNGMAIFRYEDGMFAEVYNSSVFLAAEGTTEIYGDRGVIIQNHGDGPSCAVKPPSPIALKLYQKDRAELGWQDLGMPVASGQGERIAAVARAFIDAFRAGTPMCTAEEGRISVEMCLAAYLSAQTGKRVALPLPAQ